MTMTSQFVDMNAIVNFFDVFLVKFSYWSKFHVKSLLVLSGVMAIFVYKGLTRNPEIGNAPV